jgi:hypothetical protein
MVPKLHEQWKALDFKRLLSSRAAFINMDSSCKGRGVCPSCGGRRMSELAAHLVDYVIPDVSVRQWVLSLPLVPALSACLRPRLCRDVLATFIRVVFGWVRRTAARQGIRDGQCGAVTVIQRFVEKIMLSEFRDRNYLDAGV